MVGLGAANLAAGFFQGFPISSSSSRTPVAEAAGARTQLTSVVGAVAVALLLLLAPEPAAVPAEHRAGRRGDRRGASACSSLPTCGASTASSAGSSGCRSAAAVGVVVLGAIPGIGLAIVLAVIEFLWDGWRPDSAVLGRVKGINGYHDISRYPDARLIPGLVLFRWARRCSSPMPSGSTSAPSTPSPPRRRRCAGWW
jgi:MFS superfamily sulfate permease-like transporter